MKFYLPDFYYKYDLNFQLISLLKEHPEYFYEGIEIGAVYGTYPGAIWNGGRVFLNSTDFDNIKITTEAFNKLNIPVRFTFSNCLIEEKHLNDTYCNLIMEIADNGMNEVIINSKVLEEYLRKNYPNYKYILSTTKCERDVDRINQLCENYDLVVTDYRDNDNFDFLSKLNQKDKIELLINAYCDPKCKIRDKHYLKLSECQLNHKNVNDLNEFSNCPTYNRDFYSTLDFNSVLKREALYSTYINMGFSNFKIEGRTIASINVLESYIYYLIKPEYQNKVRLLLMPYCK